MIKRYMDVFKSKPLVTAFSSSLVIGYSICLLYIILIGNNMKLYEIPQIISYYYDNRKLFYVYIFS